MSSRDAETAQKDEAFWNRPLTLDFKGFFQTLGKATLHTSLGKWDELVGDAIDLMAAAGIERTSPQLAGLLLRQSMRRAAFDLLRDYLHDFPSEVVDGKADKVALEFETELTQTPVNLDRDFLERPAEIDILPPVVARLESWLAAVGIRHHSPKSIAVRLPSYFVYGMHCEFRDNPDVYAPLQKYIETPVGDALERDRDWVSYRRWLEWKLDEPMFGEGFSLKQLFQWPRGWYEDREPQGKQTRKRGRSDVDGSDGERQSDVELRYVTDVRTALDEWLAKEDAAAKDDAIRILSGDPGAGKSSFARMYAQHRFEQGDRVLLVPLHLLDDPRADFAGELEQFCKQVPDRPTGLLDDKTAPEQLLLILDGLDELSKQGAAGASVAQAFVETVEVTVRRRNNDGPKLRVLISGRPLAVQSVRSGFLQEGRLVEMLPYWIPEDKRSEGTDGSRKYRFTGDKDLLAEDQRQKWWQRYGELSGDSFDGLPTHLDKPKLLEITAQPLHNFLIALVYQDRDNPERAIDFDRDVSLNEIYDHLLWKVFERGWGDHDKQGHVATEGIEFRDFRRLFEEMALTAWHHRERLATVKALSERCTHPRLKRVLKQYEKNFTDGVAQLFAAFYIRKSDRLIDAEETYEFTHKSFGEYLTACRIVSALTNISHELNRSEDDTDSEEPWDETKALLTWLKICGPTEISSDLLPYLQSEVAIRFEEDGGADRVEVWRQTLARLINEVLKRGMPCERLEGGLKFHELQRHARQAESALLILHQCCVRPIMQADGASFVPTEIKWPEPVSLGTWLRRLVPQRAHWDQKSLVYPSLVGLSIRTSSGSKPDDGSPVQILQNADLYGANLEGADLIGANLEGANLNGADLYGANLEGAHLRGADLYGANLEGAHLIGANLNGAHLSRAHLEGANLNGADLIGANLEGAHLRGADLYGADLIGADLYGADLEGAHLEGAHLRGANLEGADLRGANLEGADLYGAKVTKEQLKSTVGKPRRDG